MKNANSDKKRYISVSDIVFAAVILAVCLALFFLLNGSQPGNRVLITQGGDTLAEFSLNEDRTFSVGGDFSNTVVISDGSVRVTESTCHNHICEKTGRISQPGQSIICAPNRLVITVKGGSEIDAISE